MKDESVPLEEEVLKFCPNCRTDSMQVEQKEELSTGEIIRINRPSKDGYYIEESKWTWCERGFCYNCGYFYRKTD